MDARSKSILLRSALSKSTWFLARRCLAVALAKTVLNVVEQNVLLAPCGLHSRCWSAEHWLFRCLYCGGQPPGPARYTDQQ